MISAIPNNRPPWATWANLVTVLRLVLVVPTVVLIGTRSHPVWALALLVVFGASDWVDGFLARRLDQTSAMGQILDPLVDRFGLVAIIIAFVVNGQLPLPVILVVLGTDLVLLAVYLVVRPDQVPRVSPLGKVRTALLMTGLALLGIALLPVPVVVGLVGLGCCAVGAALHLGAGADYLRMIAQRTRATSIDR